MASVSLARNAMATRFEIVLHGDDPIHLRAAGEQALDEIDRLEDQLSLYRPHSEIARLNRDAASAPVKVTPALFALLEHAQQLTAESQGAFDITIAPLVDCWGFMHGTGHLPDPDALAEARSNIGMQHVELNAQTCTVRFRKSGVRLDLGAIGKGYAIERAAESLRDLGVTSALLHGGTSTVYAIGRPPNAEAWCVAIEPPGNSDAPPIATTKLRDEALSVSAPGGKSFQKDGRTFGHVIDPRTGNPADNALLAAVILPSATETDALSTALLTMGVAGHKLIGGLRPKMRSLVLFELNGSRFCEANGVDERPS